MQIITEENWELSVYTLMLCDEEEGSPKVCYSVKAQTVFDELSNYFSKYLMQGWDYVIQFYLS